VEYAEMEARNRSELQTQVDQLQMQISTLNDRVAELQLAEAETIETTTAARILETVATDAKLEVLLSRVNEMELILEQAEAVEQGLLAELQNREEELEEMDQDIDHVSMRAAGAEMMLEDLNIKLFNEEQARKEAEVKLSRVNEEVEKLRAQYAQATSAGSAREAEVCTYYLLLLSVTISLCLSFHAFFQKKKMSSPHMYTTLIVIIINLC
jgi:chromosome segregation ATPase